MPAQVDFNKIKYTSFCFSLGTTSFRTKNFNRMTEWQLDLLDQFWNIPENATENWEANSDIQTQYYNFLKAKGFVSGDAGNKPKDAREKTAGLVDLGLITEDRKLSDVGKHILAVSKANDFTTDNMLQIPKDSFIYLKQLLKTSNLIDGTYCRPMLVLIHLLNELGEISKEEFTYLYPLCTNSTYTDEIIDGIKELRRGKISIDEIIIHRLMEMDNYKEALKYFKQEEVTQAVICIVGMNRKSNNPGGKAYDKAYFPLYEALKKLYVGGDYSYAQVVYEKTKDVKIGLLWRNLLFDTVSIKAIATEPASHLRSTNFDGVMNEQQFKEEFFKTMHLLKAKATLQDYQDLNARHLKLSDTLLFADDKVEFDIAPKCYFNLSATNLYAGAFKSSSLLFSDCQLKEIDASLDVNENSLLGALSTALGTPITTIEQAGKVIEDRRYARFNKLIDSKFTDIALLQLLDNFELRKDDDIQTAVTDNADVPTIFEYVLGIIWYKASERKGKILDYMKLSLDADLLPKTHAAGGEADIVYEYEMTSDYPKHEMLLEATLADGTGQRHMEMEPVSRHLGNHLLKTGNKDSYCVFATTNLDINVMSDFRGRKNKNAPWYNTQDKSQYIQGMKIIPLQTTEIKKIIQGKKTYKELYDIFETAYQATLLPHEWYDEYIVKPIA